MTGDAVIVPSIGAAALIRAGGQELSAVADLVLPGVFFRANLVWWLD